MDNNVGEKEKEKDGERRKRKERNVKELGKIIKMKESIVCLVGKIRMEKQKKIPSYLSIFKEIYPLKLRNYIT